MEISDASFQFFQTYLKQISGYHLFNEKKYLLASRIDHVLNIHKLDTLEQLIAILKRGDNAQIIRDVLEAMTINETLFFRNENVFDVIAEKILPQLTKHTKHRKIRVWSAASSTGQEAYSMAILLHEKKQIYPDLSFEILATDINQSVVAKAETGLFTDIEINRGMPDIYRQKYFTPASNKWQISNIIKQYVQFKPLNLAGPFDITGLFDLVLLRNVLIYFDATTRNAILNKIAQKMQPEGYLLLGGAEALHEDNPVFKRCGEMIELYCKQL